MNYQISTSSRSSNQSQKNTGMKTTLSRTLKYSTLLPGLFLCASFNAQATTYTTSYSYDIPNGITTKTDPNGRRIRYHYDVVNRLSKIELLDTAGIPTFNYEYDLTDQITSITYPGGSQSYTYDDFDRLQTLKDFGQANPLLTFSYDHQDRITWITYTGNGAVCYEYDPDDRITRVGRFFSTPGASAVCSSANEKTNYVYDNKGRIKTITSPNGIQSFMEYDAYTGQVKVAGHRRTNGALIYSDTFVYYPNSPLYQSITRKTLNDTQTTQYIYDAYERVKTITEANGRTTVYTYDAFGNRLTETITGTGGPKPAGNYVYQYATGSNRLSSILYNGATQETFTYNNAGRITQRVHSTHGTTNYTYDDRGLLTQVSKPGITVSFTYDALGVRKTKTVNGVTTHYLTAPIFGMSHVLGELDASLNFKAIYVYAGPRQLKEEPAPGDRTKDLYLLHDGIVGSITHAIDPNGSIRNEHQYDAFGNRTQQSAATTGSLNHYGYTGEEYDAETGLVYLRARYYDPTLGRFISADPYLGRIEEPVTQNRYIYVQNNPLLNTDPSGLDSFHVCRPLNSVLGSVAAHCFVVSDAEWIGDTNAIVHTFGDNGKGMLGSVDKYTQGMSATTWRSDVMYWERLSSGIVPNSSTQLTGSTVSVINAPDSSVRYFANSLNENLSYALMLGVNSNAAAYAIAYSVDNSFTSASGSLMKPTATNWRNITFDVEMCTK